MDGELQFNTQFIRDIGEKASDISRLLKKYSERLESIAAMGIIFSGSGNYSGKENAVLKEFSRLTETITEYSKEFLYINENLTDISYIYENAEDEVIVTVKRLPSNIGSESNKDYQADAQTFSFANFNNIKTRYISSNELIMPDWLMNAVAKFNIFLESEKRK